VYFSHFFLFSLLYIKKHKNVANDRNNLVTYSEKNLANTYCWPGVLGNYNTPTEMAKTDTEHNRTESNVNVNVTQRIQRAD